jgi:DNA-binding PadR family transcriptional regulator
VFRSPFSGLHDPADHLCAPGRGRHRHGRGKLGRAAGDGPGASGGGNPWGGNPFGGNPFGRHPFWRLFRAGRARRGDVRAAVLALLSERPMNGYQIMQELEQRSHGMWRPSPGSVYPALQQLLDEGLVRAEESGGGRAFELTEKGRAYVEEHADEVSAPWEAARAGAGGDLADVIGLARQVGVAAMQVAHAGTAANVAEARKVLQDARRALYRILAEDATEP